MKTTTTYTLTKEDGNTYEASVWTERGYEGILFELVLNSDELLDFIEYSKLDSDWNDAFNIIPNAEYYVFGELKVDDLGDMGDIQLHNIVTGVKIGNKIQFFKDDNNLKDYYIETKAYISCNEGYDQGCYDLCL